MQSQKPGISECRASCTRGADINDLVENMCYSLTLPSHPVMLMPDHAVLTRLPIPPAFELRPALFCSIFSVVMAVESSLAFARAA